MTPAPLFTTTRITTSSTTALEQDACLHLLLRLVAAAAVAQEAVAQAQVQE
jgi:hypothetical protein